MGDGHRSWEKAAMEDILMANDVLYTNVPAAPDG